MFLDIHYPRVSIVRTGLSILILPIQYTVDFPSKMANTIETDLITRKKLLHENILLKNQVFLLQSELQKMSMLEDENNQLRSLLGASPRIQSDQTVVAELLDISADPFIHEMTLNKGKNQNIRQGQAVLDSQGVLGQIIQAGPITSRLLLITDARSAIPVQNLRTGERSIIIGTGTAVLHLLHIAETTDVRINDKYICSGLGGYFPAGYPVGVVTNISKPKGENFAQVSLTPSANLSDHQVLVVQATSSLDESHAKL